MNHYLPIDDNDLPNNAETSYKEEDKGYTARLLFTRREGDESAPRKNG
jgi:hypothetical protein